MFCTRRLSGFKAALILPLAVSGFTLAGCAGGYGATQSTPSQVGQAVSVRQGRVVSVREVRITPDNSIIGAVTGAVLGGLAGSELGGGDKAKTAGGIGGAVIGGIAGNQAGKALNTRAGYAYIVQFDNGDTREIVQGADIYMAPGSRVNVSFGDTVKVSPAY